MFSVSSPLWLARRHLPIKHPQKLQNQLRENTADEQTMQAFNQITPKTAMAILGNQNTGMLPFFFLAYCSKYQEPTTLN